MLDEFQEEDIVRKVGGRFKLSSLIQKRLVALNRGSRPLIDTTTKNRLAIVVQEIMNDKIFLDTSGNLVVADHARDDHIPDDAGPSLDDVMPG
jgi:DNA-directed RNA polymerase subunit omega